MGWDLVAYPKLRRAELRAAVEAASAEHPRPPGENDLEHHKWSKRVAEEIRRAKFPLVPEGYAHYDESEELFDFSVRLSRARDWSNLDLFVREVPEALALADEIDRTVRELTRLAAWLRGTAEYVTEYELSR